MSCRHPGRPGSPGPALATTTAPIGDKAPFTYHELDGPQGSERYLLSANSGRALEHAILTGAEKRLGRPVRSLHDLDDYYHVGPVEQYLMQTGQVYFRKSSSAGTSRFTAECRRDRVGGPSRRARQR